MRKINKGLLLCSVLFMAVILGMSVYTAYPDMQMKAYLNKQEYDKAVRLYNTQFADTEEKDAYTELFMTQIKRVKTDWKEGRLTYRDAELLLGAIANIEHKEIAAEAKDIEDFVLVEGQAKECYEKAEIHYSQEEYEDALKEISKIDSAYLEYSKVENLLEDCVKAILEQTTSLDSVGEYEKWIHKLDSYYEIIPEAAFITRKAQLEQDVVVLKDVIDILKRAADFYGQNVYKAAFATLESGLEKYPDNEKMQEAYKHYHIEYVSKISGEVVELCENKDYKNALIHAENAKEIYECDDFLQLIEYVKEEKNILYKWKNSVVDFFRGLKE